MEADSVTMLEISMQWRLLGLLATLALGCLAALLAVDVCAAERARPLLIGALTDSWGPTPQIVGLRDGLLALSYRENEDFVIGVRFTQGDVTALPAAAQQFVHDKVSIIFVDHDEAAKAARQATTEIPIVCVAVGDPVGQGLIQSFARPGGNITGAADLHLDLGPKRLEVFREIVPGLRPNMADTTIVPLIPVPNHPAYVSNAAIISSAIAALVGAMYPQEAAQWQYLGEEAGLSRIYAGIHYPSDERAGNQMGRSIAALAIQRDQGNGL
jgi:hypothetical protein